MKHTYKIENLDCAHCAAKIEEAIGKLPGVESASVNFLAQKMVVNADDEIIDELMKSVEKIVARIEPDCRIIM